MEETNGGGTRIARRGRQLRQPPADVRRRRQRVRRVALRTRRSQPSRPSWRCGGGSGRFDGPLLPTSGRGGSPSEALALSALPIRWWSGRPTGPARLVQQSHFNLLTTAPAGLSVWIESIIERSLSFSRTELPGRGFFSCSRCGRRLFLPESGFVVKAIANIVCLFFNKLFVLLRHHWLFPEIAHPSNDLKACACLALCSPLEIAFSLSLSLHSKK